jgi:hypothetical protein
MEERVGDTKLVEYIEQADDGSYSRLMGWPSQTDLSVKPSHTSGATLESWYPNTTPTAPSVLQWKPYKIVKTVPHVCRPGQDHPLHGALRYHKAVGWHYRYSMPFRITGRPPLPNPTESKTSGGSIKSIPKSKRWSRKPQPKIKRRAFVKLKKIKVKVKEIALYIGLPELRLQRIDQQPGFRSLTELLKVKS